tara:strand:- start:4627 stop:5253 length:627 start_codon:yes stop_codon:yes gene_type:complete
MSLLLFVAAVEKELASETFTFFLLFIYAPSQLLCYFAELENLNTRDFINKHKWLYSYNAPRLHIYFGCLISYLTYLLCAQVILLFIFVMMLNLFAIGDLLILSAFEVILLVAIMQLFLFSIICCLNSILNVNKLIKYICSLLIFLLTLVYLFNVFDSSFSVVFNNLSGYIRGNQLGVSSSEIILSSNIIFFSSLILIFINYKTTLKFY